MRTCAVHLRQSVERPEPEKVQTAGNNDLRQVGGSGESVLDWDMVAGKEQPVQLMACQVDHGFEGTFLGTSRKARSAKPICMKDGTFFTHVA